MWIVGIGYSWVNVQREKGHIPVEISAYVLEIDFNSYIMTKREPCLKFRLLNDVFKFPNLGSKPRRTQCIDNFINRKRRTRVYCYFNIK